jgi:alpha-L-arabinofuranosidase
MQDALDLIEFANGSVTSKWGSIRAQMGHPNSFGLTMLGIGNEQWETVEVDYFERYRQFEKVIHEKYPEMRLIGSVGPDVLDERYNMAWEFYYEEKKKNPNFVYAIDEHYYKNPDWFYDNLHFYDDYKRDIAVFAGEYAAHHDNGMNRPELNDWSAALAEASYMTGLEKNGDLVVMAAYAPLLARLGYTQWSPDLIWFDDKNSYGSPSYYVQKLYGQTQGDVLLCTEQEGEECLSSVSEDTENKNVYVKLIQPKNTACKVLISFDFAVEENATVLEIVGEPSAVNTIAKPRSICLEEREIKVSQKFEYEVKPYSAQCICFKRR